jgi:outer membrane protein OmpA-like peptidoglycan-associated protein
METTMCNLRNHKRKIGPVALAFLAGSFLMSAFSAAQATEVSQQQIFDALIGKPKTRSLTMVESHAPSKADLRFIDSLRNRSGRSLSFDERDHAAAIAEESPGIDLEIYFDFDSAAVTPKAMPQLDKLGAALTEPGLNGATFLVGGHTDAKGADAYNLGLSDRRAESVKRYLVQRFSVVADNLVAIGYGKRELKNKLDPLAPENRRVQVAKLAAQAER